MIVAEQATIYSCVCDRCGVTFEDGDGHTWWGEREHLEIWVSECDDWHKIDGKDYCHECVQWNEDETELEPKPIEQNDKIRS